MECSALLSEMGILSFGREVLKDKEQVISDLLNYGLVFEFTTLYVLKNEYMYMENCYKSRFHCKSEHLGIQAKIQLVNFDNIKTKKSEAIWQYVKKRIHVML